MSLNARDFTLPGQWAKEANTTIPPIPISGQPYRNETISKAAIENGQNYDNIADSADWNQLMYLASGIALESEQYGIPRWSPLTDYVGGASLCIGTDGIPYRAMLDSGPSGAGPQDPTTTTGYWQTLAFFLGVRPVPTAAQTFYVRKDGNDNNDGRANTPDRAFLTLNGAIVGITRQQSTSPFNVTINIGPGAYSESIVLENQTISSGALILSGSGNGTNPDVDTILNPPLNYPGFRISSGALQLYNLRTYLSSANNILNCCFESFGGTLTVYNCVGVISAESTGSVGFFDAIYGGVVTIYGPGNLIHGPSSSVFLGRTNGTLNFGDSSGVAHALRLNTVVSSGVCASAPGGTIHVFPNFTLTVDADVSIAQRYIASRNGVIDTSGGGPNYFPGTANGAVFTGGQYL